MTQNNLQKIIDALPTHLAIPATLWHNEEHFVQRLWRICDIAEICLRVLVAVGLGEHRRVSADQLPEQLVTELRSRLEIPGFSDWFDMANIVLELQPPGEPFSAAFQRAREAFRSLKNFIQSKSLPGEKGSDLKELRNQLAHAGGMTQAAAERILQANAPNTLDIRLEEVLKTFTCLGDFVFQSENHCYPLQGPEIAPESCLSGVPAAGQIILIGEDCEKLTLDPLCACVALNQKIIAQIYIRCFRRLLLFNALGTSVPIASRPRGIDPLFSGNRQEDQTTQDLGFEEDVSKLCKGNFGRETIINDLTEQIKDLSSGILGIHGRAGIGKSALSALVARHKKLTGDPKKWFVVTHLFRSGDARCNGEGFLRHAVDRLQKWMRKYEQEWKLGKPSIDARSASLAVVKEQFHELLSKIGERSQKNAQKRVPRVLLILDGLDELARVDPSALDLPKGDTHGVVWLGLGQRDKFTQKFFDRKDVKLPFPDGLPGLDQASVRGLLLERLGDAARFNLLKQDKESNIDGKQYIQNDFIDAVVRRADGLPLYVELIARDLLEHKLSVRDIDRLPPSLGDFYGRLLQRRGIGDIDALVTPILGLLTLVYEPLTRDGLQNLLDRMCLPTNALESALEHLAEHLTETLTPEGWTGYRIAHDSLRQYLRTALTLDQYRTLLIKATRKYARGKLNNIRPYLLRSGFLHIIDSGNRDELWALLLNEDYRKCQYELTHQFTIPLNVLRRGIEQYAMIDNATVEDDARLCWLALREVYLTDEATNGAYMMLQSLTADTSLEIDSVLERLRTVDDTNFFMATLFLIIREIYRQRIVGDHQRNATLVRKILNAISDRAGANMATWWYYVGNSVDFIVELARAILQTWTDIDLTSLLQTNRDQKIHICRNLLSWIEELDDQLDVHQAALKLATQLLCNLKNPLYARDSISKIAKMLANSGNVDDLKRIFQLDKENAIYYASNLMECLILKGYAEEGLDFLNYLMNVIIQSNNQSSRFHWIEHRKNCSAALQKVCADAAIVKRYQDVFSRFAEKDDTIDEFEKNIEIQQEIVHIEEDIKSQSSNSIFKGLPACEQLKIIENHTMQRDFTSPFSMIGEMESPIARLLALAIIRQAYLHDDCTDIVDKTEREIMTIFNSDIPLNREHCLLSLIFPPPNQNINKWMRKKFHMLATLLCDFLEKGTNNICELLIIPNRMSDPLFCGALLVEICRILCERGQYDEALEIIPLLKKLPCAMPGEDFNQLRDDILLQLLRLQEDSSVCIHKVELILTDWDPKGNVEIALNRWRRGDYVSALQTVASNDNAQYWFCKRIFENAEDGQICSEIECFLKNIVQQSVEASLKTKLFSIVIEAIPRVEALRPFLVFVRKLENINLTLINDLIKCLFIRLLNFPCESQSDLFDRLDFCSYINHSLNKRDQILRDISDQLREKGASDAAQLLQDIASNQWLDDLEHLEAIVLELSGQLELARNRVTSIFRGGHRVDLINSAKTVLVGPSAGILFKCIDSLDDANFQLIQKAFWDIILQAGAWSELYSHMISNQHQNGSIRMQRFLMKLRSLDNGSQISNQFAEIMDKFLDSSSSPSEKQQDEFLILYTNFPNVLTGQRIEHFINIWNINQRPSVLDQMISRLLPKSLETIRCWVNTLDEPEKSKTLRSIAMRLIWSSTNKIELLRLGRGFADQIVDAQIRGETIQSIARQLVNEGQLKDVIELLDSVRNHQSDLYPSLLEVITGALGETLQKDTQATMPNAKSIQICDQTFLSIVDQFEVLGLKSSICKGWRAQIFAFTGQSEECLNMLETINPSDVLNFLKRSSHILCPHNDSRNVLQMSWTASDEWHQFAQIASIRAIKDGSRRALMQAWQHHRNSDPMKILRSLVDIDAAEDVENCLNDLDGVKRKQATFTVCEVALRHFNEGHGSSKMMNMMLRALCAAIVTSPSDLSASIIPELAFHMAQDLALAGQTAEAQCFLPLLLNGGYNDSILEALIIGTLRHGRCMSAIQFLSQIRNPAICDDVITRGFIPTINGAEEFAAVLSVISTFEVKRRGLLLDCLLRAGNTASWTFEILQKTLNISKNLGSHFDNQILHMIIQRANALDEEVRKPLIRQVAQIWSDANFNGYSLNLQETLRVLIEANELESVTKWVANGTDGWGRHGRQSIVDDLTKQIANRTPNKDVITENDESTPFDKVETPNDTPNATIGAVIDAEVLAQWHRLSTAERARSFDIYLRSNPFVNIQPLFERWNECKIDEIIDLFKQSSTTADSCLWVIRRWLEQLIAHASCDLTRLRRSSMLPYQANSIAWNGVQYLLRAFLKDDPDRLNGIFSSLQSFEKFGELQIESLGQSIKNFVTHKAD